MYHVENGKLMYGGEPMSLERVEGVAAFLNGYRELQARRAELRSAWMLGLAANYLCLMNLSKVCKEPEIAVLQQWMETCKKTVQVLIDGEFS
jgi:hypothetical protein